MRRLLLLSLLIVACTPTQLLLVNSQQADRGLRALSHDEAVTLWCDHSPSERVRWLGWDTVFALQAEGPVPACPTATFIVTWPWDALAQCESGGNWALNTGNGYYGGLQFSLTSWRGVGGGGYPYHASPQEQIRRGERLRALQGWGAWPSCSRQIGLR